MPDHPTTDNHSFARPDPGTLQDQWGDVINQELIDFLEQRVTLVDTDANKTNYTAYEDAFYLAYDAGTIYRGDGTNWNSVLTDTDTRVNVSDSGSEVVNEPTDVNFGSLLDVTDDGDGTVTITGTDTDTRTDVSDSGVTVLEDVSDINFTESDAASVSVTDDADGTVTVDVSATDTDTDTRVDVSDGGALVLTEPTDINFGSDLAVTDDGDGTVTVDSTAGATVSYTTTRIDDTDSPYTTSGDDVITADTSAGAVTVTLASADVNKDGPITVVNVSGTNAVTVQTEGTETIAPGGEASKSIGQAGWAVRFTGDGTNWDSSLAAEFESANIGIIRGSGSPYLSSDDVSNAASYSVDNSSGAASVTLVDTTGEGVLFGGWVHSKAQTTSTAFDITVDGSNLSTNFVPMYDGQHNSSMSQAPAIKFNSSITVVVNRPSTAAAAEVWVRQ